MSEINAQLVGHILFTRICIPIQFNYDHIN